MASNIANGLFGKQGDFLSHTLAYAKQKIKPVQVTLATARALLRDCGILEFNTNQSSTLSGVVLSAGVHGNETAPIELLNLLVSEILAGALTPNRPLLIVLGHPEAMAQEKRFIQHNMNRLFCGHHQLPDYQNSPDAMRAHCIEQAVLDFHDRYPLQCHLDLHTAIRASRIERFGLYPYVPGQQVKQEWLDWLARAGIGTVLLQSTSATTFSSFSASQCGSESFTLELGKVRPFGQNDLSQYTALLGQLRCLISASSVAEKIEKTTHDTMQLFEVAHEIIHSGEGFVLNVPEHVENFTEYPPGCEIWHDHNNRYVVESESQYIVFPNSKVPAGQRAGLMLRKV